MSELFVPADMEHPDLWKQTEPVSTCIGGGSLLEKDASVEEVSGGAPPEIVCWIEAGVRYLETRLIMSTLA